jgi:hypothetical protein
MPLPRHSATLSSRIVLSSSLWRSTLPVLPAALRASKSPQPGNSCMGYCIAKGWSILERVASRRLNPRDQTASLAQVIHSNSTKSAHTTDGGARGPAGPPATADPGGEGPLASSRCALLGPRASQHEKHAEVASQGQLRWLKAPQRELQGIDGRWTITRQNRRPT